jgi:hypothetical protein
VRHAKQRVPAPLRWVLAEPNRRQVARIVAALFIVFVPTAWSVVPGWARWNGWLRLGVILGWLLAALVVVITADRQNRQLAFLLGDVGESVRLRRELAGLSAIRMLIENPPEPFKGTRTSVFVADLPGSDDSIQRFVRHQMDSHPGEASDDFAVGQGATGYAFYRNEQVKARQPAVSDGSYGLTPEMCAKYKKYALVLATPMWDSRNTPIGVLSTMALEDDATLTSDQACELHLKWATVVGQLGIDLLQWGLKSP